MQFEVHAIEHPTPVATALSMSITGMHAHLPIRIETAAEIAAQIGRTEDWVLSRAGVAERHIAECSLPELAAAAARPVIAARGEPDLLITASTTPHQILPDNAPFLAAELGLSGMPSFSVHASCLSFLTALRVAAGFLVGGTARRILIVSAEIASGARNFDEPESAAILGDGAAAAMIERPEPRSDAALLAWRTETHPEGLELTSVRGAGLRRHPLDPATQAKDYAFTMKGPLVYRVTLPLLQALVADVLAEAGLVLEDVDLIVPHQASGLALQYAAKTFGVPDEKVVNVIARQGNCVAASLPLALATAGAEGRIRPGMRVLLVGTGAGLAVGAAVLRIGNRFTSL